MKINFFKTAFLGIAALLLASCNADDSGYFEPANSAYGVIANASPSSGDLYFYADDNQIGTAPLNYADARGYYNFFPGERTISVRDDLGQTLASADVSLAIGNFFSAFAVNTFNDLELVIYEDNAAKPTGNTAAVRFINLSPDAPAIDVDASTNLNYATGLEFKQTTEFITLNAGDYEFIFSNASDGTEIATKEAQLVPGHVYTIYAKGFVTPPTGSNDTFSGEVLRNY